MSDNEDKESKTEEATEHRLRTAIEKGNIPHSREVAAFGPLLASLVVLIILANGPTLLLVNFLAGFIERPGEWSLSTRGDATNLLLATFIEAGRVLLPAVTILAVLGVIGSIVQNRPRIVFDRIKPQLSRVSIAAGWKRVFGIRGLVEFGKGVFKLVIIASVSVSYLNSESGGLLASMLEEPIGLPHRLFGSCLGIFGVFAATSLALVAADWLWVRFTWKRDLRMTRQELKDEMKQMDGDPIVKARLRSLVMDRARRRMISAVRRATLVIANPTHFAVALRYVRSEGGAPVVIAKGKDLIALRIREIAVQSGIPVVEDKPLARSLYDSVDVDGVIPPEFYRAVAKIILFLTARGKHS